MRCLSCNCNLSDREANRKYENADEISNPEAKYIGLCDDCIVDTDLLYTENPHSSNENYETDDSLETTLEDAYDPSWSER